MKRDREKGSPSSLVFASAFDFESLYNGSVEVIDKRGIVCLDMEERALLALTNMEKGIALLRRIELAR
jgi:hypothetical protein